MRTATNRNRELSRSLSPQWGEGRGEGCERFEALEPRQYRACPEALSHSNTWRSLATAFFLLAALLSAHAQTFSLDSFSIDGGGGTSIGGVYAVSGTIGQADAGGPMSNGRYSITGGFWALPTAVQTTDAPLLKIVPVAPGQVRISWTPGTAGFVLQEASSLSPANWVNSPSGAANPATVQAISPAKFYRLFKP